MRQYQNTRKNCRSRAIYVADHHLQTRTPPNFTSKYLNNSYLGVNGELEHVRGGETFYKPEFIDYREENALHLYISDNSLLASWLLPQHTSAEHQILLGRAEKSAQY